MAVTPQPCFTVDAAANAAFDNTSHAVLLPGTIANDTVVRLVNVGNAPVYVLLGTSAVTVTPQTGVCIAPGAVPTYLGINGATYIAGVVSGPNFAAGWTPNAILNISTGN